MPQPLQSDSPEAPGDLVAAWRRWRGAIDCAYTDSIWPAAELRAAAADLARRIAQAGVAPDDCVAVVLSNTVAFPVTLMALLEHGANPVLLYAGTPAADLDRIAQPFGVRWLVHDFHPDLSRIPADRYRNAAAMPLKGVTVSLQVLPGDTPPAPVPMRGVILHPTSGTYGASKFCVRDQAVAVAEGANYIASIDCYDAIRIAVTTPLSHAYAYGFGLVAALLSHSTIAIDTAFNPKRVLARERRAPSGILAIVPPMAKTLAQLAGPPDQRRMANHVFYAGAPCDATIDRLFCETFDTPLHAIYGTTETGAIATSYGLNRANGSVGKPLANVSVAIRNTGQYATLGSDVGEIHVRSTSMMQGYVTALPDEPIGYWYTGDIGTLENGQVRITGRTKDIINVGGMKVDPAEVETILRSVPEVIDVAVYPGLRDDGNEFVQAAVHAQSPDIDTEQLRRVCLEQLDVYKAPAVIHVVDRIPRTPSGKCLKIQCPSFPPSYLAP